MTRYDDLLEMIEADTDECIEWPYGRDSGGYGRVWHEGRKVGAHQVSLATVAAQPTPKHEAAHGPCHNRACVNPKHLSWKTSSENKADKYRDGTDQNGERNARCRCSTEAVADIRARYKGRGNGPTQQQLADEYDISRSHVANIVTGAYRLIA